MGAVRAVYNSSDEEIFGIAFCYYVAKSRLVYNRVANWYIRDSYKSKQKLNNSGHIWVIFQISRSMSMSQRVIWHRV